MSTDVFSDLEAEYRSLDAVLSGLSAEDWQAGSGAAGWTVADVVLHLAQSEEGVLLMTAGEVGLGGWRHFADNVDDAMAAMVRDDPSTPEQIFARWRAASARVVDVLRGADPAVAIPWVTNSLKPRTLATTRLAEHWAHALDITGPLGVDYPDTERLRHIVWLGHSTLPYAFGLAGQPPAEIYCELIAPDGDVWRYGPPEAASSIRGAAGAFCRVGAQRLAPQDSGLVTTGPHGATALRLLRNYADR